MGAPENNAIESAVSDLVPGHYGQAVVEAVNDTLEIPGVEGALSIPSKAMVGVLQMAVYEVLSGADLSGVASQVAISVANIATQLALETVESLVGDAAKGVSSAIPLVGTLAQVAFAVVDWVQTADAQERADEYARRQSHCNKTLPLYQIQGSSGGKVDPSDIFVQQDLTPDGDRLVATGRRPYIGSMLWIVTEHGWPDRATKVEVSDEYSFDLLDETIRKKHGLWPVYAKDTKPRWRDFRCGRCQFSPAFKRLREAISEQAVCNRFAQGLPAGDQGRSLWPLYLDLLFAAVRLSPGDGMPPELDINLLRALYANPVAMLYDDSADWWAYQIAVPYLYQRYWAKYDWVQRGVWPNRFNQYTVYGPSPRNQSLPCQGNATKFIEWLEKQTKDWKTTVDPPTYDDAQKISQMALAMDIAHDIITKRLDSLGLRDKQKRGVADTLARAVQAGLLTDAQARRSASDLQQMSALPSAGKAALLLGVAGLGLLIARRKHR